MNERINRIRNIMSEKSLDGLIVTGRANTFIFQALPDPPPTFSSAGRKPGLLLISGTPFRQGSRYLRVLRLWSTPKAS